MWFKKKISVKIINLLYKNIMFSMVFKLLPFLIKFLIQMAHFSTYILTNYHFNVFWCTFLYHNDAI